MEKSNAIQILNSRKLATEAGKYQAKVTNVTPFERDGQVRMIVNLALMTAYNLSEAKRLIKEGDYQGATNQNVSASQRLGTDYVPSKGEIVDVVLDYVNTKKVESALLVVSLTGMKATKAASVNFSLDDEEEETEIVAESTEESTEETAVDAPAEEIIF